MSVFIAIAALLTVLIVAWFVRPLLWSVASKGVDSQGLNAAIYRDQLQALERDRAKGSISVADYESFADGTTLFTAEQAAKAFEDRAGDPTSLPEMARRINPFLVSAGIAEQEGDLKGLFLPQYTTTYLSTKK